MEFKKLYNEVNKLNSKKIHIEDSIDVNFLDVLKEKEITVPVLSVIDCKCVSNDNKTRYYEKCPDCKGKSTIILLNEEVKCARCRGTGLIAINGCPICHGEKEMIAKKSRVVRLSRSLLDNPVMHLDSEKEDIEVKVNIIDKDYYELKGNDVYSKRIEKYSEKEIKNGKKIATVIDFSNVLLDEVKHLQVVCVKGKGINGGDYYFPAMCDVEKEKGEDIYANLVLKEGQKGVYISKKEIFEKQKILTPWDFVASGDENYLYVDASKAHNYDTITIKEEGKVLVSGGNKGDLYIKIFMGNYFVKGEAIYGDNEALTATELASMKKTTTINNKKIVTPIKQLNEYLLIGDYGLLNSKGESGPLFLMIKKEEK